MQNLPGEGMNFTLCGLILISLLLQSVLALCFEDSLGRENKRTSVDRSEVPVLEECLQRLPRTT